MDHLIGKKLPALSLEVYQNNTARTVALDAYKGKWLILFFYPADFTFVCPTELGEMAERYPAFQKLGAEVVSISTDTVFTHKAWHESSPTIQKIRFPMAADPSGKLCRALGTYLEDEGLSLRATFIVDPEGAIRVYEIHDNRIGRSAEEVLRKLQAALFVSEHPGQVCPASWTPGKKTLTPDLALVGKL